MDAVRESKGAEALRAYVRGDSSEPILLSAFRSYGFEERSALVGKHRGELTQIDDARATILESMLLPLGERSR